MCSRRSRYSHIKMATVHIVGVLLLVVGVMSPGLGLVSGRTDSEAAREFLEWYNDVQEKNANKFTLVAWTYNTNLTDYNQQALTESRLEASSFARTQAKNASRFNTSAITDYDTLRQLRFIKDVGISGYNRPAVLKRISQLQSKMSQTYSEAKWCRTSSECLPLNPDLTKIMANSRDYKTLLDVWSGWRDVSGKLMRAQYKEFVALLNEAIKAEGRYKDIGEYYRSWYDTPSFEEDIKLLYEEIKPLYSHLHAYVRRKLRQHYGADKFPISGHIPAHLLGNMWGQWWTNIYDLVEPYPGAGKINITQSMVDKNFTVRHMYELAEDFFTSLHLGKMPESFWRNSMLKKPTDGREVVCHASAWDMFNGSDFRIKQCTFVSSDELMTVHHEMGHIQYFMEYNHLPVLYRKGANPGFHEGVADIVTHSLRTPEHLQKVGLLDEVPEGQEGDINYLLKLALSSVAFLPFGYLVDQWRWSVFRGETTPDNYNNVWWKLRQQYQGLSPPEEVPRCEEGFDPGAKFHIAANVPYIRYFVSQVIQFQWHQALCELIGQDKPKLHRCDIYNSVMAGDRLKQMLRLGGSRPWGEAMMTLTRGTSGQTDKMSVKPILNFFKPLLVWLKAENERTGEQPGWNEDLPAQKCTASVLKPEVTILALIINIFL